MAEKIFYSMGEVAEMFDVRPSLLRHWESQFPMLRPKRNKKGNRLFTPQDVENLKLIYHLVKERGMTLEGAKKAMRGHKTEVSVSREAELVERLQKIRSLLVEVREDLKKDEEEVVGEVAVAEPKRRGRKPKQAAVTPTPDSEAAESATPAAAVEAAPAAEPEPKAETEAKPEGEAEKESTTTRRPRRRRKKEDGEEKELFAFYEQSLF